MKMIQTGKYRCLEIFLKSLTGEEGKLLIKRADETWREYPAGQYQYILRRIPLEQNSAYEVELAHCEASIAYLSESENILEDGVRFLEYQNGEWNETADLAGWYDTPNREQYHFNAYRNWINDPNGLCFYKGYYHLYYQANPHGQEWNHMYWGHTASRDLIHWVHLPYVLEPQQEILEAKDKKGGAFSGCAVPVEDEIVFYLTRHFGPPEDTEEDTVQYQTMVTSGDSIHFGEERKIIEKPDVSFSYNFRDPKVIFHEGIWQMVIGAKVEGVPAIVRYTSEDMKHWKYEGCLLKERTEGVYTFECPDFFSLDGKCVAVGSWMVYVDEQRRFQPTYYYIGNYDQGKFTVENRGLYDFGGNFYAVQSFEHEGRRIAIGWTADSYLEHVAEEKGSYGAMTIPRELSVKDGVLYQKPVEEIYSLKGKCLCQVQGQNLELHHLNQNCWYSKITFREDTDFRILIGKSKEGKIWLSRIGTQVEIETEGVKSRYVSFVTEVEKLREAEIFTDRRVVEIYLNAGEKAGTKLFYQDGEDGIFHAEFEKEDNVESIEIYEMKGIWR